MTAEKISKVYKPYKHRYFIGFIFVIFVLFFYTYLTVEQPIWLDYVLGVLLLINIVFAVETSTNSGLILSIVILFVYGGIMFYQSITGNSIQLDLHYIWLAAFPLSVLFGGLVGENIRSMEKDLFESNKTCTLYQSIDQETGFGNLSQFLRQTEIEMAEAKRYEYPLTLGVIEILYFDELKSIYKNNLDEIFRILAEALTTTMRIEDTKYRIDSKTFAILLPHTDLDGATILKHRIKEDLLRITFKENHQYTNFKFEIHVGLRVYEKSIDNPLDFKNLAEKELEYDV